MANNVLNRIKIKGGKGDIANFLQKCPIDDKGEKVFSFNQFIPMPENPIPNWYDWSIEHWGTKWDARDSAVIELDDGDLELIFISPWSCPLIGLKEVSKLFPNLVFEGGYACEFIPSDCGKIYIKNGILKEKDMEGDVDFACSIWGEDPAEWQE